MEMKAKSRRGVSVNETVRRRSEVIIADWGFYGSISYLIITDIRGYDLPAS